MQGGKFEANTRELENRLWAGGTGVGPCPTQEEKVIRVIGEVRKGCKHITWGRRK